MAKPCDRDSTKGRGQQNAAGQESSCSCPANERRIDLLLWGSFTAVFVLCVLALYFPHPIQSYAWLATMSQTSLHMMHAMWWGIAIGIVFIGLLSKIPRVFVLAVLGPGGTFRGLLRAAAGGVLLDLCSHGILMVASSLYQRGASVGQVMAFLLASPWNSLSLTLVLIGLIGAGWTFTFIILSMLLALTTGWLFDRLVALGVLPRNPNACELPANFEFWKQCRVGLKSVRPDWLFFKDIASAGLSGSKMVLRWLLFGILLAAVLRALLDPSQFEHLFGPTLLGLSVTIAVATIMEVCSEGSAPIAADIVNQAQAPGNGFAFLVAGVATDYTEIMVLRDTTGSWKLALFLPLITVPQVLLLAWLINVFSLG